MTTKLRNTPKMFGAWHLLTVLTVTAVCVLISWKLRRTDERKHRIILFSAAGILLFFEVLKQILLAYDGGSYSWWTFPFQPCSIIMYAILAAAILQDGAARQWVYVFLVSYGLFSGLTAMFVPTDLFRTYNIALVLFQSMTHHGVLIAVGVYLIAAGKVIPSNNFTARADVDAPPHPSGNLAESGKAPSNKNFLRGTVIFGAAVAVAIVLNIAVYHLVPAVGKGGHVFNMMYVSPYFECTLPIVGLIAKSTPYIVWVPVYIILFSFASWGTMHAAYAIKRLAIKRSGK